MAVLFLMVITAALLRDLIPYSVYKYVHMLPGLILAKLIFLHAFLNRGWIKANYFKKRNNSL